MQHKCIGACAWGMSFGCLVRIKCLLRCLSEPQHGVRSGVTNPETKSVPCLRSTFTHRLSLFFIPLICLETLCRKQISWQLPGKNIRWDPANPTWDPRCVPGGIPPFSGGIPGGIMEHPAWDPTWDYGTSRMGSRMGSHMGFRQLKLGSHLKS